MNQSTTAQIVQERTESLPLARQPFDAVRWSADVAAAETKKHSDQTFTLSGVQARIARMLLEQRYAGTPYVQVNKANIAQKLGWLELKDLSPVRREIRALKAKGILADAKPTGYGKVCELIMHGSMRTKLVRSARTNPKRADQFGPVQGLLFGSSSNNNNNTETDQSDPVSADQSGPVALIGSIASPDQSDPVATVEMPKLDQSGPPDVAALTQSLSTELTSALDKVNYPPAARAALIAKHPAEAIIRACRVVGDQRRKVKNVEGFIAKAIALKWDPATAAPSPVPIEGPNKFRQAQLAADAIEQRRRAQTGEQVQALLRQMPDDEFEAKLKICIARDRQTYIDDYIARGSLQAHVMEQRARSRPLRSDRRVVACMAELLASEAEGPGRPTAAT